MFYIYSIIFSLNFNFKLRGQRGPAGVNFSSHSGSRLHRNCFNISAKEILISVRASFSPRHALRPPWNPVTAHLFFAILQFFLMVSISEPHLSGLKSSAVVPQVLGSCEVPKLLYPTYTPLGITISAPNLHVLVVHLLIIVLKGGYILTTSKRKAFNKGKSAKPFGSVMPFTSFLSLSCHSFEYLARR
ncbi:EC1118_1D0_7041p [Saccharomyces cerevisiae EC1118]|uniref:EC1118_1D0_7041p n=1 Tax=Saccharomyces cerevisiae (strain Lalvin EC1118 / Prise de mousse) TaxID=643680 RepID=C8Z5W5_YEAS8|nr:EC1118_1D0_7041p [Saccharomyces cerevisiae EC1118]